MLTVANNHQLPPTARLPGADALFEDPARRSTSVGVTANPVKVGGIRDFGSVEQVGERLLAAERAKVGVTNGTTVVT